MQKPRLVHECVRDEHHHRRDLLAFTKYLCIDNRPGTSSPPRFGSDGEYTVYADGYSESKFRSIRVGMTVRQVEEIMGPPLMKGSVAGPQWERTLHAGS